MDTNLSYERYQRQIILKELGVAGQQKLLQAKVLVIGAGGLGCPALQYLAAAGIGTIGIVDNDRVSLSNLHRQVLFTINDIGSFKVNCARNVLQHLNDTITITAYDEKLTTANALSIMRDYDVIIDGTDNFATRYLVNDACVLLGKPLVFGAVSQFEGQVAIFNRIDNSGSTPVNYRDLFPQPPTNDEVLNCAQAGVLGVLPGIIGTLQANEAIKLIAGIGKPLVNLLLTYNVLSNEMYQVSLHANPRTPGLVPADEAAFMKMDYDWLCAVPSQQPEISIADFNKLLNDPDLTVMDVREYDEQPAITAFPHTRLPLAKVLANIDTITTGTVVVFCQSGKRSQEAARILTNAFGNRKQIFSLEGGIINWIKNQELHQP